jgi:hypothetical protein
MLLFSFYQKVSDVGETQSLIPGTADINVSEKHTFSIFRAEVHPEDIDVILSRL